MNGAIVLAAALGSGALANQAAVAEQQKTFELTKSFYFQCSVAWNDAPAKTYALDVSYFEFADHPGPQINFRDPSRLISGPIGWVPKGFALSRITSDGQIFAWLGRSDGTAFPKVDETIELDPKPSEANRATLSLTLFKEANPGTISVLKLNGECGTRSGKAAWDLYQSGGSK